MAIGQQLPPFRSSRHYPLHRLHLFSEFTILPDDIH